MLRKLAITNFKQIVDRDTIVHGVLSSSFYSNLINHVVIYLFDFNRLQRTTTEFDINHFPFKTGK